MGIRDKCRIIQFQDFGDLRGKLVVIEGESQIPFCIRRVFYIYGSDPDVVRGQHANRDSEFILVNVCGSSRVRVSDGMEEAVVSLDKPMMGLYIPRMVWKEMYDFSSHSVLLALASTHYDEAEYIRDYSEYLKELDACQ